MSLLELEDVRRSHPKGGHGQLVLNDVCLQIERGEMVAVWGQRRSGRTTLLRVAAGVEPIDGGTVRFDGRLVCDRGAQMLGSGIGYCQRALRGDNASGVLEQLMMGQLARGTPARLARRGAASALERTTAGHCAARELWELDAADMVRVSIAQALVLTPSLLVIDEPVKGVDLLERDGILTLLRSLADEGIAVLLSVGETTALAGADRALALADGQLRGSIAPQLAEVLPLRPRSATL